MDILTAVQAKGLQMKRVATTNGGEWAGPCPVCAGNDRFRVWPQKEKGGGFYCRQCDKAGDLIEFYKWADKMSYPQACEAAGMDAKKYDDRYPKPTLPKSDRQAFVPRDYADPSELWREHAEKFVAACHAELMNNAAAMARLEQSRGINAATVERFMLGMNLDQAFYRPRVSWGLPEEIKENGKPKKLWIPRGLVIPFYDDGDLMRVRVRRPKEDLRSAADPRYYFVPGSSAAIMRCGDRRRAYVVVESDLDFALVAQEAGELAGVLSMGTSSAKPDAACHAHLSRADVILVAIDFDEAGAKAWEWWRDNYPSAERWPVPAGKDPGEMFRDVDVRAWVVAGLPSGWALDRADLSSGASRGAGQAVDPVSVDVAPTAVVEPEEKAVDAPPADLGLPQSVLALGALLKRYPVVVYVTDSRLAIQEQKGWNNWEASKEISKLVYFDAACFAHLHGLGVEVVNGANFYGGVK
ncbi:MAG TPA: alpha helicase [Verrucomicrobia bacterium]|nr:alpha helicase [Verrucomicrobiota bacterium]